MNFLQYLDESKDQLDISILAAGKYLTNNKRITDFLSNPVQIEHKTDGVKLTVIKHKNKGNLDDYIFSYKGSVLYSEEYNYQPNTKVKKESIGASQFKAVFQHFKKLSKNSIPVGTELFIEFLMSKPTLSSNYNTKHKMVLIGSSKSTYEVKFGTLKTKPSGFDTSKRDQYAKELKIDVPQFLFSGIMGNSMNFAKGIQNKILLKEFNARKNSFTWDNPEILLDDLRIMFLAIESKYGGTEEGVVIKYDNRILKWQQEYQIDPAKRLEIKMKYREDDWDLEGDYWNNVKRVALEIVDGITIKSRKLEDLLDELSSTLTKAKLDFEHSKKTVAIIKDDIQLNAKTLLIKHMRGNNNALIIGKFRVLTKEGHYKLIKKASLLYDNVVVCMVTSKDTKDTQAIRTEMIEKSFPNVEIIHHSNGNLLSIMNKSPININVIYAGTDRVNDYKKQIRNNIGTTVKEMKRTDTDISASKVVAKIADRDYFEKNTPTSIHDMYDKLKGFYG